MSRTAFSLLALLALLGGLLLPPAAQADTAADARLVVTRATATMERLRHDETFQENFHPLLRRAKAALIVPGFVKAGFIIGGAYGNGVLLVRNDSGWSNPAFYRMYEGSVGLQLGVQHAEAVFLIMSDDALRAILDNRFKFGADVSVTVATLGAGMEASTTSNVGADVYAFSRNAGVFGGGALEGAWVEEREAYATAYYGRPVSAEAVVFQGAGNAPNADRLRALLAE